MKNFEKSLFAVSLFAAILLGLFFNPQAVRAGENLWVYTKGTDTRPKGSVELKWGTLGKFGKNSGDYSFYDHRPEIEYGITDRLTVSGELMFFSHNYSVDDPDLDPMYSTQNLPEDDGGTCVTDPESATDCRYNRTQFGGFELGLKYNVLSPYKDMFGLSFGLGFESRERYRLDGSNIDQKSYTATVFFQKDWMDDRLVLAINQKIELERRKGADVLEEEISLDGSMGISYRFKPKHFVGWEVRAQGDFLAPLTVSTQSTGTLKESDWDLFGDGFKLGSNHQWAVYMGPTYHYAEKDWWMTGGVLMQLAGGSGSGLGYVRGGKNYDEHESVHVGLTFGYEM